MPISQFPTLKKLLQHIRLSHSDEELFSIQCSFQGCCRSFNNLRTFQNHVYAYHDVNTLNRDHVLPGAIYDDDDDCDHIDSEEDVSDSDDCANQ